jgi:translation initiation factor 2 gamma subunit (eIF-2gamma)
MDAKEPYTPDWLVFTVTMLVVIAAQLEKAKPTIKDPLMEMRLAYQQQMIERQRQVEILLKWLMPKNVEQRVNYVPQTRDEKKAPLDPLSAPQPNPLDGV